MLKQLNKLGNFIIKLEVEKGIKLKFGNWPTNIVNVFQNSYLLFNCMLDRSRERP